MLLCSPSLMLLCSCSYPHPFCSYLSIHPLCYYVHPPIPFTYVTMYPSLVYPLPYVTMYPSLCCPPPLCNYVPLLVVLYTPPLCGYIYFPYVNMYPSYPCPPPLCHPPYGVSYPLPYVVMYTSLMLLCTPPTPYPPTLCHPPYGVTYPLPYVAMYTSLMLLCTLLPPTPLPYVTLMLLRIPPLCHYVPSYPIPDVAIANLMYLHTYLAICILNSVFALIVSLLTLPSSASSFFPSSTFAISPSDN